VPRADTGNFNRFLTSIGLLLLAAALLIPYFYFRDSDTLRIPNAELRELTPTAQQALERRQHRSADLEIPVLVLSVLLAGGGIAALFFGGKRLRIAQGKEDEAIERQARREDYEMQQLSADEVEMKRDEQAREAVRESTAEEAAPEEKEEAEPAGKAEESAGKEKEDEEPAIRHVGQPSLEGQRQLSRQQSGNVRYAQTRAEIARIEEKTKLVLERLELNRFAYFSELQIVSAGGRRQISIDGLFEARTPNQPDIAMELKVVTAPTRTLRGRARIYTDHLLALLSRYRGVTGREALGWLLIVLPEGAEDEDEPVNHLELEETYENFLIGLGKCSVVREQDLDELPSRFTEIFGS